MRILLFAILITTLYLSLPAQLTISISANMPEPLTAHAGNDTTICSGDSVQLGTVSPATNGNGGYIYNWSPTQFVSDANSPNPYAYVAQSTDFVLTVTDNNNCTSTDTIHLEVNVCGGINDNTQQNINCDLQNTTQGVLQANVSGISNAGACQIYVYALSGKIVYNTCINSDKTLFISGLSNGLYCVKIANQKINYTQKVFVK